MPFAAGLFVFLAIATAAYALLAPARAMQPDARIRSLAVASIARPQEARALLRRRGSVLPGVRGLFNDSSWARSTAADLQQAGLQLRVVEYVLLRIAFAIGAFAVVAALTQNTIGILIGLVLGVVVQLVPSFYLKSARRRRIARIEQQLIELLPSLASSLRSGFAFEQGIEAAAQQLGPPLADELALLLNDVRLGANMQDALQALASRVGSADLDIALTAVLVQRTTGGNLAEVLDQAAETLRERERIRGDVETFTAQQRMTGTILAVYPVVIGLILLAIMPSVWSKLFTEPVGQVQLAIAFALQVLGFVAIRRSLRVDV
jgi:tight adherence protein B